MGIYEYERWVEPPTEMIQEVSFSVRCAPPGRFRSVYAQRSSVRGDYPPSAAASMTLRKLTAHLWLRVSHSNSNSGTSKLVIRSGLTTTIMTNPLAGKKVSAVVAALNRNVQRATSEFSASLIEYFFPLIPVAAPSPAAQ